MGSMRISSGLSGGSLFQNNIRNSSQKGDLSRFSDNYAKSASDGLRQNLKNQLNNLNKTSSDYKMVGGKKVFSQTMKDKENGFLKLFGASVDKKLESIKNKPSYKYKEISTKIRQAKNSVSAGRALLSAKRNVSEIKRQLQTAKKEESEELQIALSHAKRMEMAARKKKNHLETEELIENTQKLDERLKSQEETGISEQELRSAITEESEEKISDMEDEVFEEQEAMREELFSDPEFSEISDEALSELNAMIAEFGEEELKALEESMEMLEDMEVIDPHMSADDLKKLKTKHRASEEKAMVKADMDYLKEMIKYIEEKQESVQMAQPAAFQAIPAEPLNISIDVSV